MKKEDEKKSVNRRKFLCDGALLGGALVAGATSSFAENPTKECKILNSHRPDAHYEIGDSENTIYSVCLQCNTGCGIKCKLQEGVVTKIDGNPWNPWTLVPHLNQSVVSDAANDVDSAICPKGQAGLQTSYDPYRIRKVLKRAGKRGENKWISIPFEQAVKEICEGGKLFSSVSGEENRLVEGLNQIAVLKDPKIAEAMSKDVALILKEKDPVKKQELVSDFKKKHAANLDKLIDPDHPDFGPKNNQIVAAFGRLKGGRSDFYKRFVASLGSTNIHGHTTVCQGSLYFTCKAISEQYDMAEGKFAHGKKFYWQADTEYSKFILFVGANLFEANYGPPNRTARLTKNLASGETKIAVLDPRFSKLASKAWKWLPLKPGSDTPVAMAIIQYLIENQLYDKNFLACANLAAARASKESSWTNASLLVEIKDGKPGKFLRAKDIGLSDGNHLVAMVNGEPKAVDPNDKSVPVFGDLVVDTNLSGKHVKTGFQLLWEESKSKSISQWCEIADVKPEDVIAVAKELGRHKKRAAVDVHRGAAQHTNGFYNVLSWMTVNMLLGNFDYQGGMCKASSWDVSGKGGWFKLSDHPGKIKPFGISSIRHGIPYESTTIFQGYPAKRNWYPISSDVYEEIIPSIGDAYPYPVKALFFYMGAPTYSLPGGHTNIDILCNLERVPLFIASDIVVGSTSMYADYIFPDTSYLERWEFQGSHPSITWKVGPIRQPVIAPIPENCKVFGAEQPICFETMMMGIAEKMGLPGFGEDAFGSGKHLKHLDDFYLRAVGNMAFGENLDGSQKVSAADERELEIFLKARRHLPKFVFDLQRWKSLTGDLWPMVVYLLNRGGRFENYDQGYKDGKIAHPYGKMMCFYQEKTATTIHSGTGKQNPGLASWIPIRDFHGNEPTNFRNGFELAMITNRTIVHTKSRTIADPWLTALLPENSIQIHPSDAKKLNLVEGQMVKVVSATNKKGVWPLGNGVEKPMIGKIQLTQQVRPGVMAFSLGFGHWATGASDMVINGQVVHGEKRRQAGIHANAAMWVDPALKNTCMIDPVGGSVSFYDTYIHLIPV